MTEFDALLAHLTAENIAFRSLLSGLLFEMIKRGQIGVVTNAFAYANVPLEGISREVRPTPEGRDKAARILQEWREEVLGVNETFFPTTK